MVKKILIALGIILLIAFLSKPNDQECKEKLLDRIAHSGDNMDEGRMLVDREFMVKDFFFFKTMVSRNSDQTVCYFLFGILILLKP